MHPTMLVDTELVDIALADTVLADTAVVDTVLVDESLAIEYLADGRIVATRRPTVTAVSLAVVVSLRGRFRPAPDLIRFDCGTTYRIGDRIDWRTPGGAVELRRVPAEPV